MKGKSESIWLPNGGWRANWPDIPFIGYMDPEWTGVGWAPRTGALAKRPHWVIEGVPHDKYYLYGKMELYIDKVTFQGAWNRKFRLGRRAAQHLPGDGVQSEDGDAAGRPGRLRAGLEHGLPVRREHQAEPGNRGRHQVEPDAGFYVRGEFNPSAFDLDRLSRAGK